MSPASKSKSKDKSSAKATKEQQKASSKPAPTAVNAGTGSPASAYNPVSGTFHALDTAPTITSPPPHNNGRFRTIDETDDHSGSSLGTVAEYDSVSNNDSCSVESEDQKEKTASVNPRTEAIPGCDNDKREKIRQKNERKHQRQRERRAQELHERCSGYLMSRKLEALAQQLVAMGFSSEQATMALILNEGRVEESVNWLFEGGDEAVQPRDLNLDGSGNLKLDIGEELARIAEMEIRFKCTKQEVERAVVASEGDLEKAADNLRVQKQEPATTPPKSEETVDPLVANGSKQVASSTPNPARIQMKAVSPVSIHQTKDDRDFNYTKVVLPMMASQEPSNRSLQSLRRIQPKAATPPEKRWPSVSSSPPSVSYSLASPLQVAPPPAKTESRYVAVGSEGKNVPTGMVREPVIMMQRPQSLNIKQNPATSLSAFPSVSSGWNPNTASSIEIMKANGSLANGGLGHVPSVGLSNGNLSSQQQFYPQSHYQQFASSPGDSSAASWGGSWSSTGTSSSLSAPSPLCLFTGWGSTGTSGSSSPVDWSMGGSMPQCDYNNIDWSLESTSSRSNGVWLGLASYVKNSRMYDGWSSTSAGGKASRSGSNGVCINGLQEGVVASDGSSSAGSREWTSPFAGQDLFSLPRQFVTSPTL